MPQIFVYLHNHPLCDRPIFQYARASATKQSLGFVAFRIWLIPCHTVAHSLFQKYQAASLVERLALRRRLSAAPFKTARRAAIAAVTSSFSALIAAPALLRSSGDILPSVARSAEIVPFLPSAATRGPRARLVGGGGDGGECLRTRRGERWVIGAACASATSPFPACGRRWREAPDEGRFRRARPNGPHPGLSREREGGWRLTPPWAGSPWPSRRSRRKPPAR